MKTGNKNEAFTLIELLAVIAIIGILAAMVTVAVTSARRKAMVAKAQADIDRIYKAIMLLENDSGEWPGHQEAGVMCANLPGGCPEGNELCGDACAWSLSDPEGGITQDDLSSHYSSWNGPYMAQIPLDPWGNEYFFDTDYNHSEYGNSVIIGSYGPNEVGNNLYDDDDIVKKID